MTKNLTVGSPAKVIFLFALPLLIGNIFQQFYQLADTLIVGRMISVEALAGVGATTAVSFLIIGFCWGMTTGLAIPVAQHFGADDHDSMRRSVAAGAIISAIVSAFLVAIATPLTRPLLTLMRTPEPVFEHSATYLQVMFLSLPVIVAFNYLSSVIRALGDSITPLVFLAVSSLLNVGLSITFIGWLGMGVAGAAIATVVAQGLATLACLVLVQKKMPLLHLRRADWKVTRPELSLPARIGLPMGVQSSIIAIGNIIMQFVLNNMGTEAVGAYTASQRVEGLAMAPLASFGIATATYVAQNYGARKYQRILRGVLHVSLMSSSFALAVGVVNFTMGRHITRLFVGEGYSEIVGMSHQYLMITGAFYIPLGLLFVWRNALQGLGKTFIPTLAGFMELAARVGVAVVIGSTLGFVGICVANPSAWVLAVAPLLPAWRRERRRLIQLDARAEDEQSPPPQREPDREPDSESEPEPESESPYFCEPASSACTK